MKTKNLAFLGLLGAAGISSMAFAPSAEAVTLTFQLNNANFNGGGNLTGTFNYNTISNAYSNINIVSDAATITQATGSFVNPFNYTALSTDSTPTATFVQFSSPTTFDPSGQNRILTLRFTTALNTLTTIGQTSNLVNVGALAARANDFYTADSGGIEQRAGISGGAVTVTAVPFESDAFPVVASGVLLAGGFWLKRKRDMAKVQLPVSLPQPPEMVASAAE